MSEASIEEDRSVSEVGTQTNNPRTGCKMTQTEKENLKTKSIQCQCDMKNKVVQFSISTEDKVTQTKQKPLLNLLRSRSPCATGNKLQEKK